MEAVECRKHLSDDQTAYGNGYRYAFSLPQKEVVQKIYGQNPHGLFDQLGTSRDFCALLSVAVTADAAVDSGKGECIGENRE